MLLMQSPMLWFCQFKYNVLKFPLVYFLGLLNFQYFTKCMELMLFSSLSSFVSFFLLSVYTFIISYLSNKEIYGTITQEFLNLSVLSKFCYCLHATISR